MTSMPKKLEIGDAYRLGDVVIVYTRAIDRQPGEEQYGHAYLGVGLGSITGLGVRRVDGGSLQVPCGGEFVRRERAMLNILPGEYSVRYLRRDTENYCALLKPSDFTAEPAQSSCHKFELEQTALRIMRARTQRGDEWPLTWEQYCSCMPDEVCTAEEKDRFYVVMPMIPNAAWATAFSPVWAGAGRSGRAG